MTRGIKHEVDRFIRDLQAQYFPYQFNQKEKGYVQLAVRPIQLWELVFPEPSLPQMQKTLWSNAEEMTPRPAFRPGLFTIRKTLGAEKIPEYPKDPNILPRLIWRPNTCAVYPIGIKKDENDKNDGHELL